MNTLEKMCCITGYVPFNSSIWKQFELAEGERAEEKIKEVYEALQKQYLSEETYKEWTEVVLFLNWKIWEHYEKNPDIAKIYNDLWETADALAFDTFERASEAMNYFLGTTD